MDFFTLEVGHFSQLTWKTYWEQSFCLFLQYIQRLLTFTSIKQLNKFDLCDSLSTWRILYLFQNSSKCWWAASTISSLPLYKLVPVLSIFWVMCFMVLCALFVIDTPNVSNSSRHFVSKLEIACLYPTCQSFPKKVSITFLKADNTSVKICNSVGKMSSNEVSIFSNLEHSFPSKSSAWYDDFIILFWYDHSSTSGNCSLTLL